MKELEELRFQLHEANETIEAIRTGQVDALVVQGQEGHQVYTLKSADQTYRVFIEKMTEGAVTLNQQGLILYCNSQFAFMAGLPLSQVIGISFEKFIIADDLFLYEESFKKCWEQDCKVELMLKTGEGKAPVQLSLTTLELQEGRALSIIVTDLTAQKKTQQQLRENNIQLEEINHALELSNHDLQQFASIASHDLQEPLRKIHMFSNLLKSNSNALSQDLQTYLQKIIDSSVRMRTLIVDILNYSRLSANDHVMDCIDLKEIVNELLEDFELMIEEKKARVIVGDLPSIDANKGQIRQVFQNIISNALKFATADVAPVIEIKSRRVNEKTFNSTEDSNGPYWLISIKDNGIGFDEKYSEQVFDLFQRLSNSHEYPGTGIGLALCRKIVLQHGGKIFAESKENEGTTFHILLPLVQS